MLTKQILDMATGVVPLVPIIVALVQWSKTTFKLADESVINALSLVFGLVFGVAYMLANAVPVDFQGWFLVAIYGLLLGLTASGLYKVGAQIAQKAALTALADATPLPVVVVKQEPPTRLSEVRAAREAQAAEVPTHSNPETHL